MIVTGSELWQWRIRAKAEAFTAGISPVEIDWILQELAGLDPLTLRLETFKDLRQIKLKRSFADLKSLWQKRLQERVPVQYLTGLAPWRNFLLTVTPAVLIPRPETELMIDIAVKAAQFPLEKTHWVDLGTGSGAIAIGLAEAFPQAFIHAVDYSVEALAVAQENARQLKLTDPIQFYQGSWWEPLEFLKGEVSGMLSNPPYIPSDLIPTLQPEVAHHEPHLALDGGRDGLGCIRHLINTAPDYLKSGGIWMIEMMAGQAEPVVELLQSQGSYHQIEILCDLAGVKRFALAFRI